MRYKVVISKNDDGYTAHCPALRGCWTQGSTEEEALGNIRTAISEYLQGIEELTANEDVREVEVTVG